MNGVEIGTIWNDWQDFWSGSTRNVSSRDTSGNIRSGRRVFRRTEIETAQTVSQTRTGLRQRLVPQVVRNSIGDRVVNVAFVPFIRSRTITFDATRMKPNTRVYAFFDNIDISTYITPSGGSLGGNIVTDGFRVQYQELLQFLTQQIIQILDGEQVKEYSDLQVHQQMIEQVM